MLASAVAVAEAARPVGDTIGGKSRFEHAAVATMALRQHMATRKRVTEWNRFAGGVFKMTSMTCWVHLSSRARRRRRGHSPPNRAEGLEPKTAKGREWGHPSPASQGSSIACRSQLHGHSIRIDPAGAAARLERNPRNPDTAAARAELLAAGASHRLRRPTRISRERVVGSDPGLLRSPRRAAAGAA